MPKKKALSKFVEEGPVENHLTPYQGRKRTFGDFECPTCERQWASANSWANCAQKCRQCNEFVYPYRQRPLQRPINVRRKRKAHPQELCQMCQRIGHSCREIHRRQ